MNCHWTPTSCDVSRGWSGTELPVIQGILTVFGVLLTFAVLFPTRRIMLLIPPIPLPAWLFVTGYALIELGHGVFGTEAGVAHFAHLGGMLGALLVILAWRRRAVR